MNRVRKRFWAVMLAAMLLLGGAAAESGTADGWQFDERGWLTGENPGDAYLREDAEEGIWEYSTADLSIRVKRYRDTKTVKKVSKIIEYCIAEVYASETNPLFSIMTPASKKKPAGYNKLKPEKLVAQNPVMLAMSDDYYGHRMQTKANGSASWPIGIIIRNGETLATTTRNSTKKRYFPPLDTLAVYGDGSMKTFVCDELKAEEYEEQGATQVFAFGPWLIRNGEINEAEAGPDSKYYAYNDPRAAIGMIEPFHYIHGERGAEEQVFGRAYVLGSGETEGTRLRGSAEPGRRGNRLHDLQRKNDYLRAERSTAAGKHDRVRKNQ